MPTDAHHPSHHPSRLGRALVAALVFGLLAVLTSPAVAAAPFERAARAPKRLGMVSFRNYLVDTKSLFRETGDALPLDDELQRAESYVARRLAIEEDVVFVDDRELRDRLAEKSAYRQGIILAREWFNLGVEHFRALRLERAIENLDRAERLYLDVYQDLVEPFALAELELYRGLALGETGAQELAHIALKQVFLFNPWKRFERGYYAPLTEKALAAALVDFLFTVNRDLALLTSERANRFLEESGLDGLVYGYLERDSAGRPRLQIVIYERDAGGITFRDNVILDREPRAEEHEDAPGGPSTDVRGGEEVGHAPEMAEGEDADRREPRADSRNGERIDRLLTRALSCLTWATLGPPPAKPIGLSFDIGTTYSIFLDHPLRELHHDLGFALGVAYQLTDNFRLHGSLAVTTSLSDPLQDLYRSSTQTHLVMGAGLNLRAGRVRFFLHPGLDFRYVGDYEWTSNPYIKFYRDFPRSQIPWDELQTNGLAARDDLRKLEEPYLLGVNLALGLNIFLTHELYLDVEVSSSAYFLPIEQTETLNFPLHVRTGLGYAF